MDKSWITKPRNSIEYEQGIRRFIDFAFGHRSVNGRTVCPCKRCGFKKWQSRDVMYDHLIWTPFPTGYTFWFYHGESTTGETSNVLNNNAPDVVQEDTTTIEDPIRNMINEQLQKEVQESSSKTEAFVKVFGKEHLGRVRGMGIGVTPSQVFGPTCYPRGSSSSSSADAKIEKLQSEVSALKAQLAFLKQTLNGNQTTNFESPREPRRSSSSSHVPEAHGASSSDTH